ncbi:MAG: polyprenyl synthetase family protein [Flavobacteriaceae bacterium]|jgi:geranylgeranyl diphosphate synthase type II|uniref:Polyprenyl synthetase family protein n=1 Tax=Flavobacterium kayseriense TaxID=2764714 RepID=A0ABR7J5G1_9FLAO|nr:polyprenyl synthetase family protein [Flavobacterium kayseriense]MBC5840717.1 polyprenyl synthetase family protein [Flavobacterium kayseriense]MBC5846613.1 polyprenyl synthetase family protein [Flavobacterium kayseriense]MBU0941046.1 polyprenyl synthetase family protein [Bacteroidota bacterium]MBX9888693.1 polyprenyl synthetase family protein [Flavobacteriaceae bacterium]
MHTIFQYQEYVSEYLESECKMKEPRNLYEPIHYILGLGGKRIRPVLTLMTAEIFETDYKKALPAALAVEVFHNFSLVHDDIMDDAPLRRGQTTVHEKWDLNTGILSGDAMLILAYQYFESYQPKIFRKLAKLFSKTALQVCEGQQWDVDFEVRDDVTIPEYLKMIEYKTAVLVAAAMKMGAIIAQSSKDNAKLIYDFGLNLGLAFQLQDDYLDAFGDPETFGKQVGGDIIENKKTYLYLKAMEFSTPEQAAELKKWFTEPAADIEAKVAAVKEIFNVSGGSQATQDAIQEFTFKAFDTLDKMNLDTAKKEVLRTFGENLMGRIA